MIILFKYKNTYELSKDQIEKVKPKIEMILGKRIVLDGEYVYRTFREGERAIKVYDFLSGDCTHHAIIGKELELVSIHER